MNGKGGGRIAVGPFGRPEILSTDAVLADSCGAAKALGSVVLPDQQPAYAALTLATSGCLKSRGLDPIYIEGDLSWVPLPSSAQAAQGAPSAHETSAQLTATQNCLDNGLRKLLAARVAPPAALYLATPPGQQRALVFSPRNELRIAEVAAAIIALAIGATLYRLEASLSRPGPAQRMPYPELTGSHRDLLDPVQHLQEPGLQPSNVFALKRHGPRNSHL
jgi:hypothetical protein